MRRIGASFDICRTRVPRARRFHRFLALRRQARAAIAAYASYSAFLDRFHVSGLAKVGGGARLRGPDARPRRRARRAGARAAGLPRDHRRGLAEEARTSPSPSSTATATRSAGAASSTTIRSRSSNCRIISSRRCWRPRTGASSTISASTSIGTLRALTVNARASGVVQGGSSHHPATRQEPVPDQRALARAQDQGSLPRPLARASPDQEARS